MKRNKDFKHSVKRPKIRYYELKESLEELQDKLTSVSKMTQQEEGRQLAESIGLSGPPDKRIEEVLKIKDETPSLISYPSSERFTRVQIR